jgi:cell division protein FtsL
METIGKIFSNLPLDKLTSEGVLIVAVLIIIVVVVITVINRKTDKIDIEDEGSVIEGLKAGVIENSENNKLIKIKLKYSKITNSEIGCIKNDNKNE